MEADYHEQRLPGLEPESQQQGPVECLGLTFPNDEARRTHFLGLLREKLRDPEFRKIEGFPIGADEDILALSDPPYYTACPNPFIEDFIRYYGKPYDPNEPYSREPFAADVSEGRYSPETLCHSYHTKVPARAVLRYILHFTIPHDVVLDGFCGTGMTGVACLLAECADGELRSQMEANVPDAQWGLRYAILVDLAPAATCIANAYNDPVPANVFRSTAKEIVQRAINPIQWMFRTSAGQDIYYSIWSDVFLCPNCGAEVNYYHAAVAADGRSMRTSFVCQQCNTEIGKRTMDRAMITYYDPIVGKALRLAKCEIVKVNHSTGKHRHTRDGGIDDQVELERAKNQAAASQSLRPVTILKGDRYFKDGLHLIGVEYYHQLYPWRNVVALDRLVQEIRNSDHRPSYYMLLTSTALKLSWMARYMFDAAGRIQNGILYIPSLRQEMSAKLLLSKAIDYIGRYRDIISTERSSVIATESCTSLASIPDCSVDYIFTDPPFGHNIQYSELNAVWEYWLKVGSNSKSDAVINKFQGKDLPEYHELMRAAFSSYYRVLKPGRWITVEFHNSRNSVWNAIQDALQSAGFVVADVRSLDKKQGAFNQVVAAGAVKQDLVISAYKPAGGLEERFRLEAGVEEGVWDFVRTHLKQLPVFVSANGQAEIIAERQNYLLFDRMVAFHVQRGVTVPLSAAEFYARLAQRFSERDGMYFLPDQVAEYDKKRMTVREVLQLQLVVTDESSAIQWLRQQLTGKPQTFQELHPQFLREIGGWQKHERSLELSELLEQNFLRYEGQGEVPNQIHSYLSTNYKELRNLAKDDPALRAKAKDRWYVPDPNKASDLEKLREKALLREFEEYRSASERRLKVFRLEAVRAGFKKAWQERDYSTIIAVAQKIPEAVLQEDPKLLMWYDQAVTRSGEN